LVEEDMPKIVDFIERVITNIDSESELEAVKKDVKAMMKGRPLFQ
jgi:glycine hydroxymethyltransferase